MRLGRTRVLWILGLVAAIAAVVWLLRPAPTAREGIAASLAEVQRALAEGQNNDALDIVSRSFQGDGYTRGDAARGLLSLRRTWGSVRLNIANLEVYPDPGGATAVALIDFSLSGVSTAGTARSIGEREPLRVSTTWAREGSTWRCVGLSALPNPVYESFW